MTQKGPGTRSGFYLRQTIETGATPPSQSQLAYTGVLLAGLFHAIAGRGQCSDQVYFNNEHLYQTLKEDYGFKGRKDLNHAGPMFEYIQDMMLSPMGASGIIVPEGVTW